MAIADTSGISNVKIVEGFNRESNLASEELADVVAIDTFPYASFNIYGIQFFSTS